LADLVVQVVEGGDDDILCGILDEDVCLGDRRCNDEGDPGKDSGGKREAIIVNRWARGRCCEAGRVCYLRARSVLVSTRASHILN